VFRKYSSYNGVALYTAFVVFGLGYTEVGSWYLNVTPDNLMMLWPATTRFTPPHPTDIRLHGFAPAGVLPPQAPGPAGRAAGQQRFDPRAQSQLAALIGVGVAVRRESVEFENGNSCSSNGSDSSGGGDHATSRTVPWAEQRIFTSQARTQLSEFSPVDSSLAPGSCKSTATLSSRIADGARSSLRAPIQPALLRQQFSRTSFNAAPLSNEPENRNTGKEIKYNRKSQNKLTM
jgi:hypothetical protein